MSIISITVVVFLAAGILAGLGWYFTAGNRNTSKPGWLNALLNGLFGEQTTPIIDEPIETNPLAVDEKLKTTPLVSDASSEAFEFDSDSEADRLSDDAGERPAHFVHSTYPGLDWSLSLLSVEQLRESYEQANPLSRMFVLWDSRSEQYHLMDGSRGAVIHEYQYDNPDLPNAALSPLNPDDPQFESDDDDASSVSESTDDPAPDDTLPASALSERFDEACRAGAERIQDEADRMQEPMQYRVSSAEQSFWQGALAEQRETERKLEAGEPVSDNGSTKHVNLCTLSTTPFSV